jgi:prevent-host-death family protein
MRVRISSTEAARNLGDCLARIRHRGERFVITKNNRPIAELGPVSGVQGTTLGELWTAMREVRTDEDFAADLERVNAADAVMENPWA